MAPSREDDGVVLVAYDAVLAVPGDGSREDCALDVGSTSL
jgi:hypothetical protein